MYKTYQKPIWILLYERGGNIYYYHGYDEFINNTSWLKIGNNSKDYYINWNQFSLTSDEYKHLYNFWAKDEFGNSISKDQINEDRNREKPQEVRYPHVEYRKDPVPRTGKGKAGYRWFKHPKTAQEMREYYKINIEKMDTRYPIHYRTKRTPSHLPTVWDDQTQSDWGNRSWKEFRKTQYK